MLAVHFSAWGYRVYMERALRARQVFLAIMPAALQRLRTADGIVTSIEAGAANRSQATADLSLQINAAASESGLTINAFDVDQPAAEASGDSLSVSLRGQGSLDAICAFLGRLQTPTRLIVVDSAHFQNVRLKPTPVYEVEFVFRYRFTTV
jgi:hypothetical protein